MGLHVEIYTCVNPKLCLYFTELAATSAPATDCLSQVLMVIEAHAAGLRGHDCIVWTDSFLIIVSETQIISSHIS